MRELRTQLRAIFAAAARGDEDGAVDRLNTMLIHHPVHPQVSRHDGQDWHLHFNEAYPSRTGTPPAPRWASPRRSPRTASAVLGTCRAEGCERVFFDTTANGSRRHCSDRCAGRPSVTAACHPTSPASPSPPARPTGSDRRLPVPETRHGRGQ